MRTLLHTAALQMAGSLAFLVVSASGGRAVAADEAARGETPEAGADDSAATVADEARPEPDPLETEGVSIGVEDAIQVVITGTRTPETAQRSTVNVDVVTRREAERRGATNVGEALQGQLGVQVNPSAYGQFGNPSAIQIQGLDGDRVLVLEDGERIIGGVAGNIDLSQLPLTDVEQIEIVTGPTSALYGTQALGGVVNIRSGPPRFKGPSARFRAEGRRPWGGLLQGQGFYLDEATGLWGGAEASVQYTEGLRLRPDIVDYAQPERKQYLTGARIGATKLGGILDAQLRFRFIRDDQLGLTEQTVPGLGAFRTELPDRNDRYILQYRQTAHLEGGTTINLRLNRQWSRGQTEKDRVDSPLDEVRTRRGDLQSMEATAAIADGDRTWVVGLRGEAENFEQRLERAEFINGGVEDTGRQEVAPTNLGHGAAYAQLKWELFDGLLTLLGGARAEYHLRYGGVPAPHFALAFRPFDEKVVVRASAGMGFRAPAAREFGFFFDHSTLGYRVIGNRDLTPETSWGVNGDVTWRPTDRAKVRVGVYSNWIEDMIAIEYLTTNPGGVDDFTYQNVAEARTFGGQVDAAYSPVKWVRGEAGYAYTWTRDITSERPLVGRPPHTAYGAVRLTVPFGFEAYTRYRVVTDAFINEEIRSVGFAMLDFRLAYRPYPALELYTGMLNALDTKKDPERLGDQRPLFGRTYTLGITTDIAEDLLP
ncbi:MAG: TonB-dependent receptor [Myxococcota bacterium]